MNQTYALAALYARRLFEDLPNTASMGSPGEAGRFAAHRVNQLRNFFFKVTHDATDFLEIGSHHAQASRYFVDQLPDERRAFAFEANTSVHEEAKTLHQQKTSIQFHNMAIGAQNTEAIFRIPTNPNLKEWGSIKERSHMEVDHIEIRVPMMTLDSAASTVGAKKSAIWMDVEGAHFDVLTGGPEFLSNSVSAIYLELYDSGTFAESASSIRTIAKLLEYGFIPVGRDNQFGKTYNLLAVHERDYDAQLEVITQFLAQTAELKCQYQSISS